MAAPAEAAAIWRNWRRVSTGPDFTADRDDEAGARSNVG
jgi:hypothetical protein